MGRASRRRSRTDAAQGEGHTAVQRKGLEWARGYAAHTSREAMRLGDFPDEVFYLLGPDDDEEDVQSDFTRAFAIALYLFSGARQTGSDRIEVRTSELIEACDAFWCFWMLEFARRTGIHGYTQTGSIFRLDTTFTRIPFNADPSPAGADDV